MVDDISDKDVSMMNGAINADAGNEIDPEEILLGGLDKITIVRRPGLLKLDLGGKHADMSFK